MANLSLHFIPALTFKIKSIILSATAINWSSNLANNLIWWLVFFFKPDFPFLKTHFLSPSSIFFFSASTLNEPNPTFFICTTKKITEDSKGEMAANVTSISKIQIMPRGQDFKNFFHNILVIFTWIIPFKLITPTLHYWLWKIIQKINHSFSKF